MKYILFFFLLFPLFVFSQSEVKTEYWDNGKILSQVHYKNGVREGSCRYYYKNGIMMTEGFYLNGKMSGYWHSFHPNGNIESKGKYDYRNSGVYSQKTGKWIYYDFDGNKISQSTIILGIENIKFYNKDGSLKSNLLNGC